ncbi:MAG TPA: M1 family metallopeptidase [Oleiagrimonas sp.]|nr:M1 family metallopeptidase [Oleiagrimonas sp.]
MPRLRLLTAALTLGLAAGAVAATPATTHQPTLTQLTRNSGGVMPAAQKRVHFDHVALHITVHPETKSIDGFARLTFTAKQATDDLLLDLDRNLPISTITIDDKPLARSAWSNPQGRIHIQLPETLAAGSMVTVGVRYSGHPHVAENPPWGLGGFVWSHTKDGKPWIASAVEGSGCDLFWPCIDNPEGEPDWVDLYVTVPKPLVAPGNGVLIGITDKGDERTFHWRAKQPDTYAVAINVAPYKHLHGEYHSRYGNTIPMDFWYLPGEKKQAEKLFATFPSILDFFEQEIGPYPWGDEKMGVVETPYLGMEHQTINAYGNHFRPDPTGFDRLLQHEFAHEWFGNQLTNADWDDMWLHEGFGTYMQPLYAQYLHGDMGYFAWLHGLRLKIENRRPIVSGKPMTEEGVYDEKTGPGQDIYNKGALMLHSLRGLIGDQAFFKSIRLLVYGRDDPKPGNFKPRYATTRNYIDIVDKVTGRKLDWFFNVYLYQAKLPKLDVTRHDGTLSLRWETPHDLPFPMPVEVKVGDTLHTLPMTDKRGQLTVKPGETVIVDPHSKLLRQQAYIKTWQDWVRKQRAKRRHSS